MRYRSLTPWIAVVVIIPVAFGQWTEPVPINIQPGPGVMAPWISNDDLRLYFSSTRDLAVMTRVHCDSAWAEWHYLPSHINSTPTQQSPAESPTGDTLYFIGDPRTDCENYGQWDVYFTVRADTGWGPVFNAGPNVNSDRREVSVGISRDGSILLVASNRMGTLGANLYYHDKQQDGNWGLPMDFGPAINHLDWSEEHPTLYPGNDRLLFYRDSPVLGDIWESRRVNDQWQEAVRLPEPINGPGMTRDEDPCIALNGQTLWFVKGNENYNYQIVYSMDTSTTSVGSLPQIPKHDDARLLVDSAGSQGITLHLVGIGVSAVLEVVVFDILGREVGSYLVQFLGDASTSVGMLPVSNLPSGLYVIAVHLADHSVNAKFALTK